MTERKKTESGPGRITETFETLLRMFENVIYIISGRKFCRFGYKQFINIVKENKAYNNPILILLSYDSRSKAGHSQNVSERLKGLSVNFRA